MDNGKGRIDPLRNPNDPLRREERQQELFRRFSQAADGFSAEDVVCAAFNLIVNGIRQHANRLNTAHERYDEWCAKFKTILADHYDRMGKRKNIFPFTQILRPPFHIDSDASFGKIHRDGGKWEKDN